MDWKKRFETSINGLVNHQQPKLLLAVSGGLDSMTLLDMCDQFINVPFGVAHCNFQLRAENSDGDAQLVEETCHELGVPFLLRNVETDKIATESGKSIQLVAREERYSWFDQLCQKNGYTHIITAHHLNDSIETTLYNFTKGGGINILKGIPAVNSKIIRPLLEFTREELEAYAEQQELTWREDASNQATKYARNKIRLQVVPLLRTINPGLEKTFKQNQKTWNASLRFYEDKVKEELASFLQKEKGFEKLCVDAAHPHVLLLITEWLRPQGFSLTQIENITEAYQLNKLSASVIMEDQTCLVERDGLTLSINQEEISQISIDRSELPCIKGAYRFSILESELQLDFSAGKSVAYFDIDKVVFPLTIRTWRHGDKAIPFGRKKPKLVSDLLTEVKMSPTQKKDYQLIVDANDTIVYLPKVKHVHYGVVGESTSLVLMVIVSN